MRTRIVAVVGSAAAVASVVLSAPPAAAILGGQTATGPEAARVVQVRALDGAGGTCTGYLFDEHWVLTAQHCTTTYDDAGAASGDLSAEELSGWAGAAGSSSR